MVRVRAERIEAIDVPDVEVDDPSGDARVLVLGWGSTYGPIGAACRALRQRGAPIAQAHLRYLHPLPANLGAVLRGYDRVVLPEMNLGQLANVIRARYLLDVLTYNQVRGMPFTAAELEVVLSGVIEHG
jgi:2-oxoglutarate ferredoxin oxidoreductase subunit alpha